MLLLAVIPLIVYIAAGAVCLLIGKWLDIHDDDN